MSDKLIYKRKKEKGMRGYHAQTDRGTLSIILGCICEILNAPLKKVLIWLGTIALILLIIFITLKVRGEI